MQINFVSTTRADISILLPLISAIDSKGYSYRALAFGLKHSETVSKEFIRLKLKGNVNKFTFNPKPQDTEQIISGMADLTRSLLDVELDSENDCVVVLGDRYELIPIVVHCFMRNIKVLHFCGGDRTLGSKDDKIRDVISKLASFHFVTNSLSMENLLKLGADKSTIINVGHIPLQELVPLKGDRKKIARDIGVVARDRNVLVTLHPDTTKSFLCNRSLVENTFDALSELGSDDYTVVFTGTNADEGAAQLEQHIKRKVMEFNNFYFIDNLGVKNFRKVLSSFDLFVGNSSSIFYEAPEFPIVSVSIGDRQYGRFMNNSILSAENSKEDIFKNIQKGMDMFPYSVKNPYKDTQCIPKIIAKLRDERLVND